MNDTGAAEHFAKGGHEFNRDAEIYLLESGSWRSEVERQRRESFYICKYATLEMKGMNKSAGGLNEFYGKI